MSTPAGQTLEREHLDDLFEALHRRGYTVVGPRLQAQALVYGELSSSADLPAGWTDEQEAGHYRVRRREDDALFGYDVRAALLEALPAAGRAQAVERAEFQPKLTMKSGMAKRMTTSTAQMCRPGRSVLSTPSTKRADHRAEDRDDDGEPHRVPQEVHRQRAPDQMPDACRAGTGGLGQQRTRAEALAPTRQGDFDQRGPSVAGCAAERRGVSRRRPFPAPKTARSARERHQRGTGVNNAAV